MTAKTNSPTWVMDLSPYIPGKPPGDLMREYGVERPVRLASNENAHGASPLAIEAMRRVATDQHRYPDPGSHDLRHRLADLCGVSPSTVVLGNGSNELITLLVRTFVAPGTTVVIPQFAFIAYEVVARGAGANVRVVDATGLHADVDALVAACDADTRLLFLANPNNPTGTWATRSELERLLRGVPDHVLVVIDEAYREYVDADDCPSALELAGSRSNLAVLRTFSKAYGLAGVRAGYGIVPGYVAERLGRVREPFNLNAMAQAGALAALDDEAFIAMSIRENKRVRHRLMEGLQQLGVDFTTSQGNFLLIRPPLPAATVNDALLRRGVIVRPLSPYNLGDYLRVTVGTEIENEAFLSALSASLSEHEPATSSGRRDV